MKKVSILKAGIPVLLSVFVVGCASTQNQVSVAAQGTEQSSEPSAHTLIVPEALEHSEGKYVSPFTSDEVVAPWVEKGMNAGIGASIGAYAGQYALRKVPFVGGYLGNLAGAEVGRRAAIEMVGGMDYIRSTTDLSFDTVEELIVYTYANYSDHPDYAKVISLVGDIYPSFDENYANTLASAEVLDTPRH